MNPIRTIYINRISFLAEQAFKDNIEDVILYCMENFCKEPEILDLKDITEIFLEEFNNFINKMDAQNKTRE